MPATLNRGVQRKGKPHKENDDLRDYFRKLEERKNVRPEQVAVDLKRSISTVHGWKYGRSKPDYLVVKFLEERYGIKVA